MVGLEGGRGKRYRCRLNWRNDQAEGDEGLEEEAKLSKYILEEGEMRGRRVRKERER